MADGIDGRVPDDDNRAFRHRCIHRKDQGGELLRAAGLCSDTGILHLVERMHGLLIEYSRPAAAELLHVAADAEREPDMVAEGSDIGTGIALHPEEDKPAIDPETIRDVFIVVPHALAGEKKGPKR